jgi:hypothetical protein
MLESTIDEIINEHWGYDDNVVYTATKGMGLTADLRGRSYDFAVADGDPYFTPRSPRGEPVLATISYEDQPRIHVQNGVQARFDYNAHPRFQQGLLDPLQRDIQGPASEPLLTEDQVKNAVAGLPPCDSKELFRDGLTDIRLQGEDARTHVINATYHGLRRPPNDPAYDLVVQGITRPQGEHPYRT